MLDVGVRVILVEVQKKLRVEGIRLPSQPKPCVVGKFYFIVNYMSTITASSNSASHAQPETVSHKQLKLCNLETCAVLLSQAAM